MQFKDKRSDTLLRNASIFVDESLRTIDLASKQLKPTSEAARFNYGIMLQLKTISQEIKRTVKLKKAINDSEKIARINLALQISAAAVCLGLIVTACVASLGIAPAVAAAAVAAAIVCHALWANYNKNKAVARVLESDFDVPSKSMEGGRIEIANRVELAVEKSVDAIHEAYKEMVSVTMEVKV